MLAASAPLPVNVPGEASDREGLPPNIILIIGDDHHYRDFGFMGSELAQTPRLDRLAEGGTVFRAGFNTSSVCQPSLLTLLTGLHRFEYEEVLEKLTEVRNILQIPHPSAPQAHVQTLPRALVSRNYSSLQTGKHWLGPHPWTGYTHGMKKWRELDKVRPGIMREAMQAGTRIVRETMQPLWSFVDGHLEQPFFVWFAPSIPHYPHDAPSEYLELYPEEDISVARRRYLASVSWFDAAVGEIIDHLESRHLLKRTLIVYLTA